MLKILKMLQTQLSPHEQHEQAYAYLHDDNKLECDTGFARESYDRSLVVVIHLWH